MICQNLKLLSVGVFMFVSLQSHISYGDVLKVQNAINFQCTKSTIDTASHQFKASGVFIRSEKPQNNCQDSEAEQVFCIQGEIQGEFYRAGKDSQREILKPISFWGSAKTYPAGTLYAKEVRVLTLNSDHHYVRITLGGPGGSSQFSNQGFWYHSTCDVSYGL